MKLEDLVVEQPDPPKGRVLHFPGGGYNPMGQNRSEICMEPGHNSADCITGWCDCPCHWWEDMEGMSSAMRGDL